LRDFSAFIWLLPYVLAIERWLGYHYGTDEQREKLTR